MEVWIDIKGFEGLYQVSNLGNVRSVDRIVRQSNCTRVMKGKLLSPAISGGHYYTVVLSNKDNRKSYTVHRLVAENFIKNDDKSNVVNHIDGNKLNNNVSNLEFITHKENMKHAIELGLWNPAYWQGKERLK